MLTTEKIYAVLTGDLVKSSSLSPEQSFQAMERIRELTRDFAELHPGSTVGKVDTFRHDSWQWLLADPALSLRAALFIRAGLRAFSKTKVEIDTRIAIGIGTIESISEQQISDSRGTAFTLSGRALDHMKNARLAYVEEEKATAKKSAMAAGIVPLLDCIVTKWTATQALAVSGALRGRTQEQTAENWSPCPGKKKRPTRQAVQEALQRAHYYPIEALLQWQMN
jgi:hypothetical protein